MYQQIIIDFVSGTCAMSEVHLSSCDTRFSRRWEIDEVENAAMESVLLVLRAES